MNRLRCSLAAIALLATLSGLFLQGSVSLANAVASRHASSSFLVGQVATGGPKYYPPCPGGTSWDC